MMFKLPLAITLAALLIACSADAPDTTAVDPESADSPSTAAASTDPTVAVRMGMLFSDTDPQLMAGAQVVRGTLRVGDHVELLNSNGGRSSVRIDEIKDDASGERVPTATAPADVFLIFTAQSVGTTAADQVLIATGAFANYAEAKSFVEARAEANITP